MSIPSISNEIQKKPVKRRSLKLTEDYVSNPEFSAAVADFVKFKNSEIAAGREPPQVTDYIAISLMKIANGLSKAPNFAAYTYREDMVMDAVENCLKAISNYRLNAPTRTGVPNAFSYFTQISFFAFLRRIGKEKKQTKVKDALIANASLSEFANFGDAAFDGGDTMIERMRQRHDNFFETDEEKPKKRKINRNIPTGVPELEDLEKLFASDDIPEELLGDMNSLKDLLEDCDL